MKRAALNELSLFTGAGGGLLGTKLLGFNHIGYVEYNDYCQRIIRQRIDDGILDEAPIFGDIRTFLSEGYAASYQGLVDLLTAGFPCQPFSAEGKQLGSKDSRNMWPETKNTISIIKPEFVLLENVRGIRKYLPVVIRDLRRIGYTVKRPTMVSSASTGALHIRERIWIFAYSDSARWERIRNTLPAQTRARPQTWAEFERLVQDILQSCVPASKGNGIHDGITNRMDRLKAIGNGQDPRVVRTAWEILTEEI